LSVALLWYDVRLGTTSFIDRRFAAPQKGKHETLSLPVTRGDIIMWCQDHDQDPIFLTLR